MRRSSLRQIALVVLAALLPLPAVAYHGYMEAAINADGLVLPYFGALGHEGEGLRVAGDDGQRYGYVDAEGNWVVAPQYKWAFRYTGGRALVRDFGGDWFYIDRSGARAGDAPAWLDAAGFYAWPTELPDVIRFAYDGASGSTAGMMTPDGRRLVESSDGASYAAGDGGIVKYRSHKPSLPGGNGYLLEAVYQTDGTLISDKPGVALEPGGFHTKQSRGDFAFYNGLAVRYDADKKKFGYVDTSGTWVIKPRYEDARPFVGDITAVVTAETKRKLKVELIDRTGKKVASLPLATCVSTPEHGRVYVGLPGDKAALFDLSGKLVAEVPSNACPIRLQALDEQTLVVDGVIMRKDGKVMQNGAEPLGYFNVLWVEPHNRLVIVSERADKPLPRSLAEWRQNSDYLYAARELRPAPKVALKEPEFHVYWAMRLYVNSSWTPGDPLQGHLHYMFTEVSTRDTWGPADVDQIAAVAGCRPEEGAKLISKELVYPKDRYKPDPGEAYERFVRHALKGQFFPISERPCVHGLLVHGPIPRPGQQ